MNDLNICQKCSCSFQGFGATICSNCQPPEKQFGGEMIKVKRGDNFTKTKKQK